MGDQSRAAKSAELVRIARNVSKHMESVAESVEDDDLHVQELEAAHGAVDAARNAIDDAEEFAGGLELYEG